MIIISTGRQIQTTLRPKKMSCTKTGTQAAVDHTSNSKRAKVRRERARKCSLRRRCVKVRRSERRARGHVAMRAPPPPNRRIGLQRCQTAPSVWLSPRPCARPHGHFSPSADAAAGGRFSVVGRRRPARPRPRLATFPGPRGRFRAMCAPRRGVRNDGGARGGFGQAFSPHAHVGASRLTAHVAFSRAAAAPGGAQCDARGDEGLAR
jgi:hypothetical protein